MSSKSSNTSKADLKAKQKILEEKTFGLKNKKSSAKVAKYVSQLEQNLLPKKNPKNAPPSASKQPAPELANLLKSSIVQPKVPFGVDPKSVLCAFFKAGQCSKSADKCKYSHDLNIELSVASKAKKTQSADPFVDSRTDDSMDKWDQQKLEQVISKKHGSKPSTDIVCKFFIEAVESSKYGWFWECPNGGDKCHYRHALPPGYVLKKDRERPEESISISLEEFLETERHKLDHSTLIPVTLESFTKWKMERQSKSLEEQNAKKKIREIESTQTGKELFENQSNCYVDDEEALELEFDLESDPIFDKSLFNDMKDLTLEEEDIDLNK